MLAKMMQADTIFDLASLTKPIATATSIMVLAEQGKIKLNDKVVRFIPEIKSKKEMTKNQTEGLNEPRGLGWLLKPAKGSPAGALLSPTSYGHTRFTGTSLWIDPVRELFIILLTNRIHLSRGNAENISKIRSSFNDAIIGSIVE